MSTLVKSKAGLPANQQALWAEAKRLHRAGVEAWNALRDVLLKLKGLNPGRFYAEAKAQLGMAPSTARLHLKPAVGAKTPSALNSERGNASRGKRYVHSATEPPPPPRISTPTEREKHAPLVVEMQLGAAPTLATNIAALAALSVTAAQGGNDNGNDSGSSG